MENTILECKGKKILVEIDNKIIGLQRHLDALQVFKEEFIKDPELGVKVTEEFLNSHKS